MDTVHEENRRKVGFAKRNHNNDISEVDELEDAEEMVSRKSTRSPTQTMEYCFLHPPQLTITDHDAQVNTNNCDCAYSGESSIVSSRRPSAIIAALRRPSQVVALSAAHAVMNQRRYLLGLLNTSTQSLKRGDNKFNKLKMKFSNKLEKTGFTVIVSALYAKILVVMGIAFPITEVLSTKVQPFYYQGFYLYLYMGSIFFITYEYVSFMKERAVNDLIRNIQHSERGEFLNKINPTRPAKKYGSFFLRLGAVGEGLLGLNVGNAFLAFGIGSMVYSGLEFGRYFELRNIPECNYTSLQAIAPAVRMILTLLQVQFIFLNQKDVELDRHKIISRFGLMHMIAMNLCEWLHVIVEETKHEIMHLSGHHGHLPQHHGNFTNKSSSFSCPEGKLMGSLVNNASPFLFPCTIEYSLICAVILFEMWKHIIPEREHNDKEHEKKHKHKSDDLGSNNGGYHFTIDCSNSYRGLFAGILIIVLTIISLVMFFVLTAKEHDKEREHNYAETEVNIVELVLYVITTIAVLVAMFKLRNLKYERKQGQEGMSLDVMLLSLAQTGMFIYSMFSIIGWYFTMEGRAPVGLVAEIFSFTQTVLQTMFVLDAWWKRCKNLSQAKSKPGREIIIFLMISNMAMWSINTLEKNKAEFRPTHLNFFGDWGWTIITHISMPLAIFYRFHSTICLFEIWKTVYKIKSNFKNPLFPVSM